MLGASNVSYTSSDVTGLAENPTERENFLNVLYSGQRHNRYFVIILVALCGEQPCRLDA